MAESLKVVSSIVIEAPADKVWKVLTASEYTTQYMFGCEVDTDWKVGSSVIWRMEHEGKPFIPVKGSVLAIDPGHTVTYTVIDPNMGIEDIPENYLHVTYTLSPAGPATLLTVTQEGYERVANGQKRYEDTVADGGWDSMLARIKDVAEK